MEIGTLIICSLPGGFSQRQVLNGEIVRISRLKMRSDSDTEKPHGFPTRVKRGLS